MPGTPSTDLSPELLGHMLAIKSKAQEYGLDFHEVIFEVLPFDMMNQIAAYGGFPVRYPHWRFGMEYEKLSKRDAYGLGRIYEMVINTDPVYAYLQESNGVTDQKLVMSHVYGHADFFKNNAWFSKTNRKMLDEMANHSTRVRRYIDQHGGDVVEHFIDACLSLESLIDTHSQFVKRDQSPSDRGGGGGSEGRTAYEPERFPAKDYMEPFINPQDVLRRQKEAHMEQVRAARGRLPERPDRDVLAFLIRHAPLEEWQRDVLSIVREEAYYFVPQAMTKIMNEGWASYWHSKLMTRHFCEASEIIHYCDQHSGVIHMPDGGFNPYKIGIELWKDIERRWDTGQHGPAWERLDGVGDRAAFDDSSGQGREKIFQVRRVYNDVMFVDEFLTEEFVTKHRMYQTKKDEQTGEARIASHEYQKVKQTLLHYLTNRGEPFIYVVDGNYLNRGELYLAHQFSGLEIEAARAGEVLRALRMLWGRPVHLQMRVRDEMCVLTCEEPGGDIKNDRIGEDTPKPAHMVT